MPPKPTRRDDAQPIRHRRGRRRHPGSDRRRPPPTRPANEPFGYCFNTSTIRGQKLPLVAEIEIAARAGYQGIEPWVSEIDQYVAGPADRSLSCASGSPTWACRSRA